MISLFLSICFLPLIALPVEECYYSSNVDCPTKIYQEAARQLDGCTSSESCTVHEETVTFRLKPQESCHFKVAVSCFPIQQPTPTTTTTTTTNPTPGIATILKWAASAIGGVIATSILCLYGPTMLSCIISTTSSCCTCCTSCARSTRPAPDPITRRGGRTETAETVV